jgi:myo-inositol-1(or 4)-monophosphatase
VAPFSLEWLNPVLDQCREDISLHSHPRAHDKPASAGVVGPVTDLDLSIEKRIIAASLRRYPQAGILSEESFPDPAALSEDLCFVIDPIDGTKEMVAGRDDFSISVGVMKKGRPVAGVLDFPRLGQRFTCEAGAGARVNECPLRLPDAPGPGGAVIAVSPTQLAATGLQPAWDRLRGWTQALVPVGALTPKVAQVLLGNCHAAVYLPLPGRSAFIWDYVAAALLLAEAGGGFFSFTKGNLLTTLPVRHDKGWIAGPPALCRQLSTVVR